MPAKPAEQRLQYRALAAVSIAATALTAILSLGQRNYFERYFGSFHPLLVMAVVVAAGFAALGFLQSRGWFEIYLAKESRRGIYHATLLAALFVVPAILVDVFFRFPRDINVPAPQSLLFYPAVGYVAEVVFHALPLAALLGALGGVAAKSGRNRLLWLSAVLVSLIEPVFQLSVVPGPLVWRDGYVGAHVFAFNLVELHIFRRYGFVSMYSCRLVYYLLWHVVWGDVRLRVLF